MNSAWETIRSAAANLALLTQAAAGTVRAHWALSFFSVATAFVIWFIVEDVENPRVERVVPVEGRQAIPVTVVNQSDDIVVLDPGRVQVRVDAREEVVPSLRASDFRATVDASGLVAGQTVERAVEVESVDGDAVRVLEVIPATVQLRAVEAVSKEVLVTANLQGELPAGFDQEGLPQFNPAFVTVTGTREQVEMVDTVEADISLDGLRSTTTTDVILAARTANGNEVEVNISEPRVQVTLTIEPTFMQRQVPLLVSVEGQPALGYHVTGRNIDPPLVTIEGPDSVIEGIEFLSLGRIDVTGAEADLTESRTIEVPPNVTANAQTAIVTVGIAPIDCAVETDAPCTGQTFVVPVTFEDVPAGLTVAPGAYSAQVRVVGPLGVLNTLTVEQASAVVSLAEGAAGTSSYPAMVNLPPELSVAGPVLVEVTLVAPQ